MATEVWFRNPDLYIHECVELLATHITWDRGYLVKKRIDPSRFADLYYPANLDYRMLVIGDQGSAELRRNHTLENPAAVYPTWEYGEDDIDLLVELLAANVADNPEACDPKLPADERPVAGQEHRVVIIRPPLASTGPGRRFFTLLRDLQEEFPDALMHVHGLYSYRVMFGMGYGSVDVEPRLLAKKGKVTLPSGKEVTFERAASTPQWVNVVGFRPADLKVPRNRCMFNMRSAWWAAEHYRENLKFRVAGTAAVDAESPTTPAPATVNAVKTKPGKATVGDKFLCDTCSLQDTCKYFRSGGVCSIPESEPASLARFFKTRNADTIIEGLSTLLAAQTRRYERGLAAEEEWGELDPEVTKIADGLFSNGVKLAKLLNPALNGGPKVQVNVGAGGAAAVGTHATPHALMAGIVAELEARGVERERITPEMVMGLLERPAIEAHAVSADDDHRT